MRRASQGQAPPEFLSDHLSDAHRVARVRGWLPEAVREYKPRTWLAGAEQSSLHDERQEQVAVAVVVEEHRQLIAVVALHRSFSPSLTDDSCADCVWLVVPCDNGWSRVVVAVAARPCVALSEVREQERAAALGVLRVAPHHLEPRTFDLVLTLRLVFRLCNGCGGGERSGPADRAACVPRCSSEIDQANEGRSRAPGYRNVLRDSSTAATRATEARETPRDVKWTAEPKSSARYSSRTCDASSSRPARPISW